MIISIYNELKQLTTGTEIQKRLSEIGYWEMFEPLAAEYPSKWPNVFRWIVESFSIESDSISINEDFEKTRWKIAKRLNIEDSEIVLLKKPEQPESKNFKKKPPMLDPDDDQEEDEEDEEEVPEKNSVVGEVVLAYLEKQGDREFRHLMILRLSYERALNSAIFADIEQTKKNLESSKIFYADIQEWEQRVAQRLGESNYRLYKDLDKNSNKQRIDLRLESSKYIQ